MKSIPNPARFFNASYYSEIDPGTCTGCETCQEKCQMSAISMVDAVATVDRGRCLGCGQCASACPSGAITLKPVEQAVVPAPDYRTMYDTFLEKRASVLAAEQANEARKRATYERRMKKKLEKQGQPSSL
jgi:ferredoxin